MIFTTRKLPSSGMQTEPKGEAKMEPSFSQYPGNSSYFSSYPGKVKKRRNFKHYSFHLKTEDKQCCFDLRLLNQTNLS